MALEKTIISDSGAAAKYHRIIDFKDDRVNFKASVTVGSFLDQGNKNKSPLGLTVFTTGYDFPYCFHSSDLIDTNHIAKAYEQVKLLEPFIGATDV